MSEVIVPESEQLPSSELLSELRTPEELLEMAILSLQDEASRIAAIKFNSAEDAQVVLSGFNQMALEKFNSIDLIGQIEIEMSGEGVRVPNNSFEIASVEGKTGISLVLPDGSNFVPLQPYETEIG
ncbi:MAG: hypothetical protein JWM52_356, partial [Candidatus Saccharibacteria bacterium]|nr:hypothetical protein [Candidatus Saccharibacteria bacterium]